MRQFLLTGLLIILFPFLAHSHSGRTDSSGCHKNRKTGDYHCHNRGKSSSKDSAWEKYLSPPIRKPTKTTPAPAPSVPINDPPVSIPPVFVEPKESILQDENTAIIEHHTLEAYRDLGCAQFKGRTEYSRGDGSTGDCLNSQYAIEFAVGKNWQEVIARSLYSSIKTGKKAGIILIIENDMDKTHLRKLKEVIIKKKLDIKLWTMKPDAFELANR